MISARRGNGICDGQHHSRGAFHAGSRVASAMTGIIATIYGDERPCGEVPWL